MSVGTNAVSLRLPDHYSQVAAELGLTEVAAGAATIPPSSEVGALLRGGQAAKVRVSLPSVSGRRKTSTLICSAENLDTVTNALVGKNFKGVSIMTAYFPSRRRLS